MTRVPAREAAALFMDPPQPTLYPAVFGDDEMMRPEARERLIGAFMEAVQPHFSGDLGSLVHFVGIGDGFSYNWHLEGDLDIQVWVDVGSYDGPAEDIVGGIRAAMKPINFQTCQDLGISTPGHPGLMEVQYYAKEGKGTDQENLDQRPYACYDLDGDRWILKPVPFDPEFYADLFLEVEPDAEIWAERVEDVVVRHERAVEDREYWTALIARNDEPEYIDRAEESQRRAARTLHELRKVYRELMELRAGAYSPGGAGVWDPRDATRKLLEVWGVWDRIKQHAQKDEASDEEARGEVVASGREFEVTHPEELTVRDEGLLDYLDERDEDLYDLEDLEDEPPAAAFERSKYADSFEERLSRCYELAARFVQRDPNAVLVHGSIQGFGNPRIGHAWVELSDGRRYDPVLDDYFDAAVHEAFFNVEEYERYSHDEVMKNLLGHGHWGPWHDEPYGLEDGNRFSKIAVNIPPEPGETPIPEGHVRLFHSTNADPESLREQGLLLNKARGGEYGENNVIWAQAGKPLGDVDNTVATVEFSMDVNDPALSTGGIPRFKKEFDPHDLEQKREHVTISRDISPDEIVAVHEPWHSNYRYLETMQPDTLELALEDDWSGVPDVQKAVDVYKRQHEASVGLMDVPDVELDERWWWSPKVPVGRRSTTSPTTRISK